MSKITLKQLSLVNFKGVRNLTIDLDSNTYIFGANGTGKTSVFDAFTWLLFGKNSEDKKDFEVKRLDKNGNSIQKTEVEVSAIVWVDNEFITIKRILKEKWVKQRGSLDAEFTGNETLYYWNEVPLSMKEFQTKVSLVLDEQIFKLITSPTAFNSLKWQDRRNVLVQIAGDVSNIEILDKMATIQNKQEIMNLTNVLNSNKTIDEYKKQIASTIKKAKDDIKTIPTRVDEVERGKPAPVDVASIESEISFREREIENIDKQLQDKSVAYDEIIKKKTENQNKIFELKSQLNTIEFEIKEKAKLELKEDTSKADTIRRQIRDNEGELQSAQSGLKSLVDKRESLKTQLGTAENKTTSMREDWHKVNAEEFKINDSDCNCPICKKPLDDFETKIEDLKNEFLKNKNTRLKSIEEQGKSLSTEKKNLTEEIETLDGRISKGTGYVQLFQSKLNDLKADLLIENNTPKTENLTYDDIVIRLILENVTYQNLKTEIQKLEDLKFDLPQEDNSDIKEYKKQIQSEVDNLRASLFANEQIKQADKRIADLQEEEKKLAQEIANIEKIQYTIDNFIKLKIDTIEGKINDKFQFVKFKLFQTQINGAEVECCDALIDGVPFSDANTASKINAGVDIINTLCNFYNVSAPIFIDNRESVVDLIDSNSQIINLIVSAADAKLRVA